MANAIVGSGKLLLLATLFGVPIGFFGAIYLAEFGGGTIAFVVRYAADLLNGVPSIVIGIFAYSPRRSSLQAFLNACRRLRSWLDDDSHYSCAAPRSFSAPFLALCAKAPWLSAQANGKPSFTVIVPAAYRGILTAILLAFARVAGETAPLLFTAFGNRFWSPGLNQPTASLPAMIYNYAISPYDDWHRQAWAAGLVLLGLILVINILARGILSRGISVSRS